MATTDIATYIQLLKSDLALLKSIALDERSSHIENKSKPLLRSIFGSLGHEDKSLASANASKLCEYLIEYLNINYDIAVESTMCLYRLKNLTDKFNEMLEDKIDNLLQLESSKYDRYKIIKIVSHLFTFDSTLCSEIFVKKAAFLNMLTNECTLLTNSFDSLTQESIKNWNYILVLFSNACVDEPSRSMIASMYINILLNTLSLPSDNKYGQSKCYASTITIKLWRMIKPEIIEDNISILSLSNLLQITLSSIEKGFETSVEALSLLSTNIQVKQQLRNKKTLDLLLKLIKNKDHTKFGIISVLSFITKPKRLLIIEQRSSVSIKDSNSIENLDIHTNEKIDAKKMDDYMKGITFVCNELFQREFITNNLVSIFKSLKSSKGLIGECLRLMLNLVFQDIETNYTTDKELYLVEIKETVQIIKLITAYLIGTSQNIKYSHEHFVEFVNPALEIPEQDLEYRSIAIKALTSPFISENVEKIYSGEEMALSSIPFILEILIQYDIDTGVALKTKLTPFTSLKKQVFTKFDVYYGYVSLSAICSLEFEQVKKSVFTLGFDSISNTIREPDERLQHGALQLLNEICDFPMCIAKFFNWENTSDDYYKNFELLCYLIHANNYDSQCLILQIFYSVSRFGIVAEKMVQNELFCKKLNDVFQSEDSDDALIFYALLVLTNILPLKTAISPNYLSRLDSSKSIILKHVTSPNDQVREASTIVAKYL